MHSSTSNFKAAISTAAIVVREFAGPALVAALLLSSLGAWRKKHPTAIVSSVETVVVETQRRRSHTIADADVLIIGDSSALMNVDPRQLSEELSARVESLATIGFMGPRGYAKLLTNYSERAKPIGSLVILMHPTSLAMSEEIIVGGRYEQLVLDDGPRADGNLFVEGRRELYNKWIDPAAALPLPGAYGRFYGWAETISRTIESNHGSMTDPHPADVVAKGAPPSEISPAVATRIPDLKAAIARSGARAACVGVTPIPARHPFSEETYQRFIETFGEGLGVKTRLSELPAKLPDPYFASMNHMTPEGRRVYTALLARQLTEHCRAALAYDSPR